MYIFYSILSTHLFNLIQYLKCTFYIKLRNKEIRQKEIERRSKVNSRFNEKESLYLFNNDLPIYVVPKYFHFMPQIYEPDLIAVKTFLRR